jgi:hypothetical protein
MYCRDCTHWDKPKPEHESIGRCNKIEEATLDQDEKALAYILGFEYADLYTKPEFGCVQFESLL